MKTHDIRLPRAVNVLVNEIGVFGQPVYEATENRKSPYDLISFR